MIKKIFFSILILVTMQFYTASAAVENAKISFYSLDDVFRISLNNVDISQVSDCTWDGVSICADLMQQIQKGDIIIYQSDSQLNIDISLAKEDNFNIFNKAVLNNNAKNNITPIFALILSSGEILSSPVIFSSIRDISNTRTASNILDTQFEKLIHDLEVYKINHPEASDKTLNEYAEALIEKANNSLINNNYLRKNTRASTKDDDPLYQYIYRRLNAQEYELYKKHPVNGLICIDVGRLAIKESSEIYDENFNINDDNPDAFRHALWTFYMTFNISYDFANTWSTVHEDGDPNNTKDRKWMDMYNNKIGLLMGTIDFKWYYAFRYYVKKDLLKKIDNGELRILRLGVRKRSDHLGKK
jgi:hypothetical protein